MSTPWVLEVAQVGGEVDERLVDVGAADAGVAAQGGLEDPDGRHGVLLAQLTAGVMRLVKYLRRSHRDT